MNKIIVDDFLHGDVWYEAQASYNSSVFRHREFGNKTFYCAFPTESFRHLVRNEIVTYFNDDVEFIFEYFRRANKHIDTDWNIHYDYDIMGDNPTHAFVYYLGDDPRDVSPAEPYGTAFWSYKGSQYGVPNLDEFHKMLQPDISNNPNEWELDEIVAYKKNRLLIYPARRFHSAFPNIAQKEGRTVYVGFFKVGEELPF